MDEFTEVDKFLKHFREEEKRQREQEALEILADTQHDIWAHWMKYLFSLVFSNTDGSVTIPVDKVTRWERQMRTPYAELSDGEKDSDRDQARKIKAALNADGFSIV